MAEPTPEAREAARKALVAWSLDCAGGEWLMADEAIDLVDRVARAIDDATRRERELIQAIGKGPRK